jgi:uncharacterized protein YdbL (DUF1318 family)
LDKLAAVEIGGKMRHLLVVSSILIIGCTARPEVQVTLVDTRTALENQVLGSYRELNREFVMIASVRSVDEKGIAEDRLKGMSASQRDAMKAMQAREFNRDDIDDFKRNGCVGENNMGLLEVFPCERAKGDSKYERLIRDVVKEENDSRMVIMRRVIVMNEGLKDKDLPEIQKVFARMNQDAAGPGELIQREDGSWIRK